MAKKKWLNTLTLWLVLVGALNWGLIALGFNLVSAIFGTVPVLVKVIYGAVGLSAVYQAYKLFK